MKGWNLLLLALLSPGPTLANTHLAPVEPIDEWRCPFTHPIKGNLTTESGECIFHTPESPYYSQTKPEVCFAEEPDALDFGCRPPLVD